MKETTDSKTLTTDLVFTLDVRIPDQFPKKIEVNDKVMAGLDPRNDLILVDSSVSPKQFLFRKRNNLLSVHYLGQEGKTTLNDIPLLPGKLYLLEKGDVLKCGKIEIIIRRETGAIKSVGPDVSLLTHHETIKEIPVEQRPVVHPEKSEFKTMPRPKALRQKKKPSYFQAIRLIPVKAEGFLFDVALTYFILGFVFPKFEVTDLVQDLVYPISRFLSSMIMPYLPYGTKILSLIEFAAFFHLFMISSALIIGNTPGAMLAGLSIRGKNPFLIRFKAYLLAVINVFALPFLIFDIPFFRGKTVKELISSAEHELSPKNFFTLMRKVLIPLLIIASFFSPLLLSGKMTAPVTMEKIHPPRFKDVHTTAIKSSSHALGLILQTELLNSYALLPLLGQEKMGLALYDLSTNEVVTAKETERIETAEALFKLRYSNPFASLFIPNEQIENEALKILSASSLTLGLEKIGEEVMHFGLFFANGFTFKTYLLKDIDAADSFSYNSFGEKNPALSISALINGHREERLFLFTRKEIIRFTVKSPLKGNMGTAFLTSIISPLRFDQGSMDNLKNPQILEALDGFYRNNYGPLLTYYINEAKMAAQTKNAAYMAWLVKNIQETKRALKPVGNNNILKSFDDIILSLKPN